MINNKNSFLGAVLFFTVSGILLMALHYVVFAIFPALNVHNVLHAHVFLFLLTLIAVIAVLIVAKKTSPRIVGYVFLSTTLFKMVVSVIYLYPVLRGDSPHQIFYVIQFFIIYFFYLFAEVYYLAKKFKN